MKLVTFSRLVAWTLLGTFSVLPTTAAPKIGLLLKSKTSFWKSMESGALEAGRKQGIEIIIKTPPSENDIAIQVQLLAALAAQGVDAIIIAPSAKDALKAPLAALAAKGMKIVIADSFLGPDSPGVFVGTNQRAAGEEAGKLLSSLVADGDEISLFKHTQASVATTHREQGGVEGIRAARPNSVIHGDIYAGTDSGKEGERALFLLKKYPKTKGILSTNTVGTFAMIEALKKTHAAGAIKLVGFGFNLSPEAVTAIQQDFMQGWVAQLPHQVGAQSVDAAAALIKGEPVPAVIHVPFVVITKDNLNEPEVQALLLQP